MVEMPGTDGKQRWTLYKYQAYSLDDYKQIDIDECAAMKDSSKREGQIVYEQFDDEKGQFLVRSIEPIFTGGDVLSNRVYDKDAIFHLTTQKENEKFGSGSITIIQRGSSDPQIFNLERHIFMTPKDQYSLFADDQDKWIIVYRE